MKIVSHKLKEAEYSPSPNKGVKFIKGRPDTLIIHFTASSDAAAAISWLCNPKAKASAHVVVGRDGKITQLVDFDTIAWHAGKSSYGGRFGFNQYSIGIEIDNAGELEKTGDEYTSWFGRKYEAKDVLKAKHRNAEQEGYWHTYTEAQIDAVQELCAALIDTYNIKSILGHEEIAKGRKWDPGPAFPLDKMRQRLLEEDRSSDEEGEAAVHEGVVTTQYLNIRSGPSSNTPIVAEPLRKGAKVEVLESRNEWYKVRTTVEGWVAKSYVKKP